MISMLSYSLTVDAEKTLDFCNSLYHGIGDQESIGQIWASSD